MAEEHFSKTRLIIRVVAAATCLFTLIEVNYPSLSPQSELALFAWFGLTICFLHFPMREGWKESRTNHIANAVLVAATALCCLYIVVQTEPTFSSWWSGGRSLGSRAGLETTADLIVGVVGILLILEATRRSVGWSLPILAGVFLAYAYCGPWLPSWLFPHRGYGVERIVSQAFLHSQGVFGTALQVMFTYVFLFVLFGAFLEATGATAFIIKLARRLFRGSSGGPAKVAVVSSGLMGSLSGSAVANAATIGTFTIPMMRSAGFKPEIAAGIEAAASSGGALVPPIMGAGAYMMLEIIDPPVSYLQIVQAAILPAILYYVSLLLIVHFYARRVGSQAGVEPSGKETDVPAGGFEGFLFFGALISLMAFLIMGYTPFRAVTLGTAVIVVLAAFKPRTRIGWRKTLSVFERAAKAGVALVAAASCVGIVIGIVTLTGIGTRFPSLILPLAEQNLLLALTLIMVSSIVLGMGLPSAVCYLLMATLIGSMLGQLGVVPLAAHLFIFYFGMMSMVTPPVALAAYTAASIAGSKVMATGLAAFRFALVGFTLPFIFVLRPQLLLLEADGSRASFATVAPACLIALLGIVPLASALAGYLFCRLRIWERGALLVAALLMLTPAGAALFSPVDLTGMAIFAAAAIFNWRASRVALPGGLS